MKRDKDFVLCPACKQKTLTCPSRADGFYEWDCRACGLELRNSGAIDTVDLLAANRDGEIPDQQMRPLCDLFGLIRRNSWQEKTPIGEKIVDAIISGGLVKAQCPDSPESACLLVWSANVHEQLEQILIDAIGDTNRRNTEQKQGE